MKKFLVLVSIGALVVGAWVYWSPRAAARQLRDAAQTGDVEQLQRLVDFPLVQEQLRADLKVSLLRSTLDTTGSAGLGAALATGLGGMMIDGLVNQFASPSGIAALVRYGSIDSSKTISRRLPGLDTKMEYRDASTFVITARNSDSPASDTVNFVLRRRGLSWQLVRVTLPRIEP